MPRSQRWGLVTRTRRRRDSIAAAAALGNPDQAPSGDLRGSFFSLRRDPPALRLSWSELAVPRSRCRSLRRRASHSAPAGFIAVFGTICGCILALE